MITVFVSSDTGELLLVTGPGAPVYVNSRIAPGLAGVFVTPPVGPEVEPLLSVDK